MLESRFTATVLGFLAHRNFGGNSLFKSTVADERQGEAFEKFGLNRLIALKHLDDILQELFGKSYDETNGMWSEHLVIFAALAQSDRNIERILEIGTFNGETALILSKLFPNASIDTLDIPLAELIKTGMYSYETNGDQITRKRNENLKSTRNVNFRELNSVALLASQDSYDLIWVDGNHCYPTAVIDISNAYRLLTDSGIVICDDVYLGKKTKERNGISLASIQTLRDLSNCDLIEFTLLRKRLGAFFNLGKRHTQYLALFTRTR